jgi:hypothetical protein
MNYPHVTAILKDAGLINVEWFTEEMRDRGSAVHLATQYLDEGDLDEDSVLDDGVAAKVEQYKRFKKESGVMIYGIEEEVFHKTLKYQGRVDRRVLINDRMGVLDIKGVAEAEWHGAQLAAYAKCYNVPLARWNLYLHTDRYRLIERKDPRDFSIFLEALKCQS